ncbi:Uncharacterised protein [[Clostridium] sordellii]|uniref:hypothetical protein n=1 Tax=Paraclostridium sordellii TaxID=1505 RepID=UPI0005DAA254|nr:hypothetical protein [Paeniclostridium sordellii]CEQ00299.1 Uncharacterised protein [[Clostridium] sordellii] [Paeniclostridium sordellii]
MNCKDYFIKNRKLKIEEYDERGNLIDSIEFGDEDLFNFCMYKGNYYQGLDVATKSDREKFKGDELKLFKEMIKKSEMFRGFISKHEIDLASYIFENFTKEQIKFGLEFKNYIYNTLNYAFYSDDEVLLTEKSFLQILEWIKSSEGFYYAIDNNGDKGMAYINKPTSNQTKYQMQKHNKRIVFFSFNDWKEHLVNEYKLK